MRMKLIIVLGLFIIWQANNHALATSESDTALVNLSKLKADTSKMDLILKNSLELIFGGKIKKANKRLLSYKEFFTKNGTPKFYGQYYNFLGMSYEYAENIDSALFCYHKAIKIFLKDKLYGKIARVYLNLSAMYINLHDQVNSLTNSYKALEFAEKAKDTYAMAAVRSNIGGIYFQQGDYDGARKFFLASFKVSGNIKYQQFRANSAYNLGAVYFKIKSYDSCELMYREAMKTYRRMGDSISVADAMLGLAPKFRATNEFDKALKLYEHAIAMKRQSDSPLSAEVFVNISILYNAQHRYNEALASLDTAYTKYSRLKDKKGISTVFSGRAEVYARKGDFQKAYDFQIIFNKYIDSLHHENVLAELSDLKTQYEVERKESQLRAQQKIEKAAMNAKSAEERKRSWYVIVSILIVLGLIFIFSILLFRRFKISQRQNKIIAMQKQLVEHQKFLVEEKQKEILDSIHYAKRIQQAQLPSTKYLDKILNNKR